MLTHMPTIYVWLVNHEMILKLSVVNHCFYILWIISTSDDYWIITGTLLSEPFFTFNSNWSLELKKKSN